MKALDAISLKFRQILLIIQVKDNENHAKGIYVNEAENNISTIKV